MDSADHRAYARPAPKLVREKIPRMSGSPTTALRPSLTDSPAPKGISRDERRIGWMDGLRGVASVQVVLLHYVTAFLPAIGMFQPRLAHYRWELRFIQTPLFYPFDGYSAVSVFFVLVL